MGGKRGCGCWWDVSLIVLGWDVVRISGHLDIFGLKKKKKKKKLGGGVSRNFKMETAVTEVNEVIDFIGNLG